MKEKKFNGTVSLAITSVTRTLL